MIYSKHQGGNGLSHHFEVSEQEMRSLEHLPEGIYAGVIKGCVEAWLDANKESVLAGVSLEVVIDRAMTAAAEALKGPILQKSGQGMDLNPCTDHRMRFKNKSTYKGNIIEIYECESCGDREARKELNPSV